MSDTRVRSPLCREGEDQTCCFSSSALLGLCVLTPYSRPSRYQSH